MPKGDNPKSQKNLIQNQGLSRKEVESVQSKGGKESARRRRNLKRFIDADMEDTTDDEIRAMLKIIKCKALKGDLRAIKLYMDITGEKQRNKHIEDDIESDGLIEAIRQSSARLVDDMAALIEAHKNNT